MRLVMLGKDDLSVESELGLDKIFHPKFLFDPKRQGLQERCDPVRRVSKIGLDDALEFDERLIVERDAIKLRGFHAALFQAEIDGVLRKREIMFLARKALFLRRRDDLPVTDKTRRAIVVKS